MHPAVVNRRATARCHSTQSGHGPRLQGRCSPLALLRCPNGKGSVSTGPLVRRGEPTNRCTVQVVLACIYCLLAAGVVFGYAAIKPVLLEEGVYRNRCSKQELKDDVPVCYEQELRFVCRGSDRILLLTETTDSILCSQSLQFPRMLSHYLLVQY